MVYEDMREWLDKLEEEKELKKITTEVDLDGEIAAIFRKVLDKQGPALLFENIKNHKNTWCKRVFVGGLATTERVAMMLGMPRKSKRRDMVNYVCEKFKQRVMPDLVATGPVKENIILGDKINLFEIPVPIWHPLDGGRYINSWCGVVTRDPETGILNVGMYRGMIVSPRKIAVMLLTSQHWGVHFYKYKKLNQKMPVAIYYGGDPVSEFLAASMVPFEVNEYEVMGAIRNKPMKLVKCETNDLVVPAGAEIVIEGSISTDPASFEMEGPFGEYSGFYGGKAMKRPVVEVDCITHRNNPIYRGSLEGASPGHPNEDSAVYSIATRSLMLNILKDAGVTGIIDVRPGHVSVIKIEQMYQGQARQVASALWGSGASEYTFKILMVVGEDINIYNPMELDWAFSSRVNPVEDIVIFPGTRGGLLDMSMPVEYRDDVKYGTGRWHRVLIDATWNLGLKDEWFGKERPPLAFAIDKKVEELIRRRWSEYGIDGVEF